ncbi:hypothetical protein FF011L_26020 [Roseimaritima multifibrata]|uniref:Uncharacterized protein n=1 Tax=Roseimaritima multifibrata TaxID=1930274 RepID=A0A517MG22_9BACT|nr:hypothetical protein [Roseimaritima multifibrata]QDS93829.1 hypothetical protein FF011L_26020 [Roseimaritima multifibrata]
MKLEAITHLVLRLVRLAAESGKPNQTRELFNTSDLTSNLCFMPDKLAWGQFRLEAYKSVRYKSQGTSRRTFETYMPTRRASRRRKNGKRRIGCVRRNGIAIALWSGLLAVRCVRRNGIAIALWSGLLAVRCVRRNGIAIALWSGLFAVFFRRARPTNIDSLKALALRPLVGLSDRNERFEIRSDHSSRIASGSACR